MRLTVSGGASRLGDLEFTVQQTIGLGVIAFNLDESNIQVGTIGVKATSVAESTWGGNLGLGLQIPIGEHGALVLEGRGFYFPKRTVKWEPVVDRPLSAIELALLARVQERLPRRRVRALVGAGHRGFRDPLLSRRRYGRRTGLRDMKAVRRPA